MSQETESKKTTDSSTKEWWETETELYEKLVFILRMYMHRRQSEDSKSRRNMSKKYRGSKKHSYVENTALTLKDIKPKTKAQKEVFDAYSEGFNLALTGPAGTGKTFLAMYLALRDILDYQNPSYRKLLIVRSTVPVRDLGFMPGDMKEKQAPYMQPYVDACNQLCDNGAAFEILERKKIVEFTSTSFLRGINLPDTIVIVDEIQNMAFGELDTIITRMGKDSRIIFAGDTAQADLERVSHKEESGMSDFLDILDLMEDDFDFVEFGVDDIVRSKLVRNYIKSKIALAKG